MDMAPDSAAPDRVEFPGAEGEAMLGAVVEVEDGVFGGEDGIPNHTLIPMPTRCHRMLLK